MINIFSAKSIELTTVVVYMIHVPTVEESALESILLMPKNRGDNSCCLYDKCVPTVKEI